MSITYTSLDQLLATPFQRLTSSMWNTAVYFMEQLYVTGGKTVASVLKNGNLYLPGVLSAAAGDFLYQVTVQGQPVLTEEDPIYISGFVGPAISQILQIVNSQQQLYSQLGYLPQDIYTNFMNNVVPSIYENVSRALMSQQLSTQIQQLPEQIYGAMYNAMATSPLLSLPYAIQDAIVDAFASRVIKEELQYLSGAIYNVFSSFLTYFYLQTTQLANVINKLTLYLAPSAVQGLQLSVGTSPAPIYSGPTLETVKVILQNLSTYIIYLGDGLYNQFPLLPNSSIELNINNPGGIFAWATGPATVYALFEEV